LLQKKKERKKKEKKKKKTAADVFLTGMDVLFFWKIIHVRVLLATFHVFTAMVCVSFTSPSIK